MVSNYCQIKWRERRIEMATVNLEVTLPEGVRPSVEANDLLIRRFLKACSRENLQKEIYEKCPESRRYVKPSDEERLRRIKYRKNAQESERKIQQHMDYLENNKKRINK